METTDLSSGFSALQLILLDVKSPGLAVFLDTVFFSWFGSWKFESVIATASLCSLVLSGIFGVSFGGLQASFRFLRLVSGLCLGLLFVLRVLTNPKPEAVDFSF